MVSITSRFFAKLGPTARSDFSQHLPEMDHPSLIQVRGAQMGLPGTVAGHHFSKQEYQEVSLSRHWVAGVQRGSSALFDQVLRQKI